MNNMKVKRYIIIVTVFAAVFAQTGAAAVSRSSPQAPVGSAVTPVTSYQSGLYRSPNPIDTSGNLVVTGNVAGGSFFRGVVPFNSTTDFGGTLAPGTVDSFLRYAGSNELSGSYSGKITPYYSQIQTVTTMAPGSSVVTRPPSMYIGDRAVQRSEFSAQQTRGTAGSEEQVYSSEGVIYVKSGTEADYSRQYITATRPFSMSLGELERAILSQTEVSPREKQLRQEQQLAQAEQYSKALERAGDKAAEMERRLTIKGNVPEEPSEEQVPGGITEKSEAQIITRQMKEEELGMQKEAPIARGKQLDIYEQMREQLNRLASQLQKEAEQMPAAEKREKPVEGKRGLGEKKKEQAGEEKEPKEGAGAKETELFEKISREEMGEQARAILREYKSFAVYSESKFDKYMLAAEEYLKEGRYYLAADVYTLAAIYKPDDPLAYAGKSHALFAAGEYMSSALYLSRAITIFPDYVRFKIDIVGMVGDKDKLESRIAEVREWLKNRDVPELNFLLAYVYYQMGRGDEAKKSIDAAYAQMSEVASVKVLKEAIYETAR